MQYPPIINTINVCQLKGKSLEKPNKYPAIEEKTTLIANPAFVIALKSIKIDCTVNVLVAVSKKFNT